MNTRGEHKNASVSAVLSMLRENRGAFVSGEALAERIGVSRAAIWKSVDALRREGHVIEAVTRKGYRLSRESGLLSAEGIAPWLDAAIDIDKIHIHKILESTNKTAKAMLISGPADGAVILAEEQSGGRGRFGRPFFSPRGGSIYASFVLRAPADIRAAQFITVSAALAVCQTVEKFTGSACSIKWVNDVLVDGRKICGILTEAVTDVESGGIESVVLGIGVNINVDEDSFPPNFRAAAGAVVLPPERRCRFAAELINRVTAMCGGAERAAVIDEYRRRSCVVGRDIRVSGRDGVIRGAAALDIDENGGLIVRFEDGGLETLNSGEVSIRLSAPVVDESV